METQPAIATAEADLKERVQETLARNPRAMTLEMARDLGVSESAILAALPDERSRELDVTRWREIFERFEALDGVHVIVSNFVSTMEVFGKFGNFSQTGQYFNVQTKTIDMHIRYEKIGSVFAVQKPSHMDGVNTLSFQFFDIHGNSALKVFLTFGGKKPSDETVAFFQELCEEFGA